MADIVNFLLWCGLALFALFIVGSLAILAIRNEFEIRRNVKARCRDAGLDYHSRVTREARANKDTDGEFWFIVRELPKIDPITYDDWYHRGGPRDVSE